MSLTPFGVCQAAAGKKTGRQKEMADEQSEQIHGGIKPPQICWTLQAVQ